MQASVTVGQPGTRERARFFSRLAPDQSYRLNDAPAGVENPRRVERTLDVSEETQRPTWGAEHAHALLDGSVRPQNDDVSHDVGRRAQALDNLHGQAGIAVDAHEARSDDDAADEFEGPRSRRQLLEE